MKVIIVGAGLGGLSAAIGILKSGHEVTVIEAAHEIAEVGAGIQILPNAARILTSYGIGDELAKVASKPRFCYMNGWKGNRITSLDFHTQARNMGGPFWDFHRADLHRIMFKKCCDLGGKVVVNCRIESVDYNLKDRTATVISSENQKYTADLVVGADGIHSKLRDGFVGYPDPPSKTGDLAYRILIKSEDVLQDADLKDFILNPQVNYWIGPKCHCVNYVVKNGELFNFVLLCPDTIPDGRDICPATIGEIKEVFSGWDYRVLKLLDLADENSIYKWRLCYRAGIDKWYNENGMFCLLGDAVHATLPYLASGAGMCIEDGAVLGKLLEYFPNKSDLKKVLQLYEKCRKARTERIVARGNLQQYLYHLEDGDEQRERDRILSLPDAPAGEALVWRDKEMAPWLLKYDVPQDINLHRSYLGQTIT